MRPKAMVQDQVSVSCTTEDPPIYICTFTRSTRTCMTATFSVSTIQPRKLGIREGASPYRRTLLRIARSHVWTMAMFSEIVT